MSKNQVKNQVKIQVNTSLMGEKLEKVLKFYINTVAALKKLQAVLPETIKAEKSEYLQAKMEIEFLELDARIEVLEQVVDNRKKHYENDFLPKHEAQLKECNANFDKYYERAKQFVKENPNTALSFAIREYQRLNADGKNEELRVGFYQGMKQTFDKFDSEAKNPKMKVVK